MRRARIGEGERGLSQCRRCRGMVVFDYYPVERMFAGDGEVISFEGVLWFARQQLCFSCYVQQDRAKSTK